MRRTLGYKLKKPEKLLGKYLTYLEDRGDQRVRTETALAEAATETETPTETPTQTPTPL